MKREKKQRERSLDSRVAEKKGKEGEQETCTEGKDSFHVSDENPVVERIHQIYSDIDLQIMIFKNSVEDFRSLQDFGSLNFQLIF